MKAKRSWKIDTILQHAASSGQDGKYRPLNPPIYRNIAPELPDAETAAKYFADSEAGYTYPRKGHPIAAYLENKLKEVEGAEDCLLFASGMAALNCLMLELVPKDKHLVTQQWLYGGTTSALSKDLVDAGRFVTFVQNPLDLGEWALAFRENTSAVLVEMPSNPSVCLIDLEAICKLAKKNKVPVVIDNTFAPIIFNPFDWGATLICRSGSKYENLGNTYLHGVVLGPRKIIKPIREGRFERYGAPIGIEEAWDSIKALENSFRHRMKTHFRNALAVAKFLEQRPEISQVHFPALESSCFNPLFKKYFGNGYGCGGVLAIEFEAGQKEAKKFLKSLKLVKHAVNLGDLKSLITYPAATTHSKLPAEVRRASGITDTLMRLSIGLEDPNDIIADIEQALKKIK